MSRFAVYTITDVGLVVNVQSDFLDWIDTRLVIPLIPSTSAPPPAKQLNPVFEVAGETVVMITQSLSAVPVKALGPKVASLSDKRDEITRALDLVFQGF